jgi:ribosomal protein S18 acetylase RimI-like enzyme
MKIRLATKKDVGRIMQLLNGDVYLTGTSGDYAKKDIEIFVSTKIIRVFLCEIDGKVVGMCKIDVYGSYCYLNLISVDKNYRGKGIGSTLLDYVEKYLKKKGIGEIEGLTDESNKIMQNFFSRRGYKKGHKYIHYWKEFK